MRYWVIGSAITVTILAWLLKPFFDSQATCSVKQFAWTDPGRVARSAQPSIVSFAYLRGAGFTAVVNLRAERHRYNESALVKSLGMNYLLLPIADDTAPSPAQVTEYMRFVDEQRRFCGTVLTHDAAGRGRIGVVDGIYLLWRGWSTRETIDRYVQLGAKIDCENGGNGQIQLLHEIGLLLGRGDAWPEGKDQYGNSWDNCPRPKYMAGWDYKTIKFPPYSEPECSIPAKSSK